MNDGDIRDNLAYRLADMQGNQEGLDLPSLEVSQQLIEGTLSHLNLRDKMYRPNIQQAGSGEARAQ